jgi:hypothetical protein
MVAEMKADDRSDQTSLVESSNENEDSGWQEEINSTV